MTPVQGSCWNKATLHTTSRAGETDLAGWMGRICLAWMFRDCTSLSTAIPTTAFCAMPLHLMLMEVAPLAGLRRSTLGCSSNHLRRILTSFSRRNGSLRTWRVRYPSFEQRNRSLRILPPMVSSTCSLGTTLRRLGLLIELVMKL